MYKFHNPGLEKFYSFAFIAKFQAYKLYSSEYSGFLGALIKLFERCYISVSKCESR